MDPRIRTIRFWLLAVLGVVLFVTGCDMAILAAYSVSPFGLFMPPFATGIVCDLCSGGTAAESYQMDFAGWGVNAGLPTCADCADFNGTYIVDSYPWSGSGDGCEWRSASTYSHCGGTNYYATWQTDDGHLPTNYIVQGSFKNASVGGILFSKHNLSGSQPACSSFSNEDLGTVGGFYPCSGGTIKLTAL